MTFYLLVRRKLSKSPASPFVNRRHEKEDMLQITRSTSFSIYKPLLLAMRERRTSYAASLPETSAPLIVGELVWSPATNTLEPSKFLVVLDSFKLVWAVCDCGMRYFFSQFYVSTRYFPNHSPICFRTLCSTSLDEEISPMTAVDMSVLLRPV